MTTAKARKAFEKFTSELSEEQYYELEYWIDGIEDYLESVKQ